MARLPTSSCVASLVLAVGCSSPSANSAGGDGDGDMGAGDVGTNRPPAVGADVDLDGDGIEDGRAVDSNGDGVADGVDTTGDGLADSPLPMNAPDPLEPGPSSGSGGSSATGGAGTGGSSMNTGGSVNSGAGGLTGGEVLLHATFEGRASGQYTEDMVEGDFGAPATWNNGLDDGRATIVNEGSGPFLRVTYPANGYGPSNAGVQFKTALEPHAELYLAYRVRFSDGFDFVKGGKLPGLVGGSAPTGCIDKSDPDSSNGFSARMMWRTDGRAVQYVYTPDRVNDCGDDFVYEPGGAVAHFVPGTWHVVQHRIAMNTPGQADGVLQSWYDGVLALDEQNVIWRRAGATWEIDTLYFSTFFGGGDSSWAPSSEQIVDFDDFVISTAPIRL